MLPTEQLLPISLRRARQKSGAMERAHTLRNGGYNFSGLFLGGRPTHALCREKNSQLLRLVLRSGAKVNDIDANLRDPLEYAISEQSRECVRALLMFGAELNSRHQHLRTPLHLAVMHNGAGICRELLLGGIHRDAMDIEGRTALHYAAFLGHVEVMLVLLDYGADAGIQDLAGCSALEGLNVVLLNHPELLQQTRYRRTHQTLAAAAADEGLPVPVPAAVPGQGPRSLQGLCRGVIRNCVKKNFCPVSAGVGRLPLPLPMKRSLLYM